MRRPRPELGSCATERDKQKEKVDLVVPYNTVN